MGIARHGCAIRFRERILRQANLGDGGKNHTPPDIGHGKLPPAGQKVLQIEQFWLVNRPACGLARFGVDHAFVDTEPFGEEEFTMPRTHLPYPPEFRRQMVELVRSGRAIRELAREFECSDQTIRNWVRQTTLRFATASSGGRPARSGHPSRLRPRSASRRFQAKARASTTAEPASRRASARRRAPVPGRRVWSPRSPAPSFTTRPKQPWPRGATEPESMTLNFCRCIPSQLGTHPQAGTSGRRSGPEREA